MTRLLDELNPDQQIPVLETMGVPYAVLIETEGTFVIFTMEMARGFFDLRIAQGRISADEATPILEAIKEKGLLETGQAVRERIEAFELEEKSWSFKFWLCDRCNDVWPHGYFVNDSSIVYEEPFNALCEFLSFSGRVEDDHLITLLKQGVAAGLAADYCDSDDRYSAMREAFFKDNGVN